MADEDLHEEAESYEDEEGGTEFEEEIEHWIDGAGEDFEQAQANPAVLPPPPPPPPPIDPEEPLDYATLRKALDEFFHRRVFDDKPPVKWSLRNNLNKFHNSFSSSALLWVALLL